MPQKLYELDNQANTTVQNYIMRSLKDNPSVTKIGGTHRYNHTALADPITWTTRYYGRKPDGTFVKKAFAYSGDKIYMGDDVAGTLSSVKTGLSEVGNPESVIIQVAGNSRMYVFNGYDTPVYYEGDDAGTFYDSSITYKFVQGVIKDDRLWAFERNSSILYFSRALYPENFSTTYGGAITVGNAKDSFIRRLVIMGDYLYIFKNDSIWVLSGNTQNTYSISEIIPDTGLLAQKAFAMVGNTGVFVSQQDKQVYSFNGSVNLQPLSGKLTNFNLANRIDITKIDDIVCGWDRDQNLLRISFKAMEAAEAYNNHEAIYPTDDIGADGVPKWSETYGAKISCYSMWAEQGDHTLVTGRIDTGLLHYHNRGHNWDDEPIETILRTDDIVIKPGFKTQFNGIFIKGTPSTSTVGIRTYLNSRITGEGTRSSQTISQVGEEGTLESITWKLQTFFNNYIPLLTGYNYGESLAIEIYDRTPDKEIQLQHIILDYTVRSRIRNALVG